jgi:hypothetical protein
MSTARSLGWVMAGWVVPPPPGSRCVACSSPRVRVALTRFSHSSFICSHWRAWCIRSPTRTALNEDNTSTRPRLGQFDTLRADAGPRALPFRGGRLSWRLGCVGGPPCCRDWHGPRQSTCVRHSRHHPEPDLPHPNLCILTTTGALDASPLVLTSHLYPLPALPSP